MRQITNLRRKFLRHKPLVTSENFRQIRSTIKKNLVFKKKQRHYKNSHKLKKKNRLICNTVNIQKITLKLKNVKHFVKHY